MNMNKTWILLLMVSVTIGMILPAMANPFERSTNSADAENSQPITVNVDGANTATADISQELKNSGDLKNDFTAIALGGNVNAQSNAINSIKNNPSDNQGGCNGAPATSTAAATTDSTTVSGAATANNNNAADNQGGSNGNGLGNSGDVKSKTKANSDADAKGGKGGSKCNNNEIDAMAMSGNAGDNQGGSLTAVNGNVDQSNMVDQVATATIKLNQKLTQPVDITANPSFDVTSEPSSTIGGPSDSSDVVMDSSDTAQNSDLSKTITKTDTDTITKTNTNTATDSQNTKQQSPKVTI